MNKCRYYYICKNKKTNSFTCNHDNPKYCGYRKNNVIMKIADYILLKFNR